MRTARRIAEELGAPFVLPSHRDAFAHYHRPYPPGAGEKWVVLSPSVTLPEARALVRRAQALYVPVVADLSASGGAQGLGRAQLLAWSDFAVTGADGDFAAAVERWLPQYRRRVRPKISLVTVLYGKASELPPVLQSWLAQTYPGEVEAIFVDDCGPDDSVPVVQRAFAGTKIACRILRNERNLGNCISRNRGIAAAGGDLVVVIDADCLLNREFLRRHAEAHSFGDCDVVIGPLNIESGAREPLRYLAELEARPERVAARSRPQDALNPQSFLNCVTRNFSIRRDFIEGELFDPAFTYSADPASGFGWEDVEMGYRLYRRGARVKYVSDAFSVHLSHPSSVPEAEKPRRSLRNFEKLLEEHPDLALEARRWVQPTHREIKAWAPAPQPAARRLRILTYRWHVSHQYELFKLPHEFHLVSDLGSPMTRAWDFERRPLPANARLRPLRSIRRSDYDLAILHFDENVLSPENCRGVLGPDWGAAFRWFMERVELPKIAVCHGTPQFHGQYDFHYDRPDLLQVIEPARRKLVDYLGDTHVVCNSHQAQREWGFRRSSVIWHGFDPTEFPPATYERGILSPLGPLVLSRPHYRGYFLYRRVLEGFPEEFRPSDLEVPEPSPLYEGNQYALWKFRNYVDALRRFSIYFNPTLRSPMPRARGEAMLCGAVTVSAHNHDVDRFIENGVNGFYSNDPDELREQLLFLCRHPQAARKSGAAGRRTAADLFNHDRYLDDWTRLIARE